MTELLDAELLSEAHEVEGVCSFCGHAENLAGPLIGGENAQICEHCLSACNELLEQDRQRRLDRMLQRLPRPRQMRSALDRYVVGQDHAKKVLSVAVYNHYKRVLWRARGETPDIGKSNILLLGPSGSGKSHIAQTLARSLDVPFVTMDATRFTASGFIGDDVDSIITRLLAACDHDPDRAARGIVYLDEVDKLGARTPGGSVGRDVGGEGAQQALLKLIEGRRVSVDLPGRKRTRATVDTRDILFICGGAFEGLDRVVQERVAPSGVGFTAALQPEPHAEQRVEPAAADLEAFGLLPEMIGRLPIVARLDALDEEALVRVLTEPDNALVRQYTEMLDRDGCELHFEPEALRVVARRALARGTGARALRAVLEEILLEPMYTVPASGGEVTRLTVDAEAAQGGVPIYEFAGEARHAG